MAISISVDYTILADSGIVESYPAEGGPTATVKFQLASKDRYQFIKDISGTAIKSGSTIVRVFPFPYPPSPNLYARSVESIEFKGKGFLLGFGPHWLVRDTCVVTVRFEVPKFGMDGSNDPSTQPYTTTNISLGGEILTAPDGTYRLGGAVYTAPVGIVIPQAQISMKRHWMPYVPVLEMFSLIGKVNAAPFVLGNFTGPAGTLLFLGGPTEITANTDGSLVWEVEYQFSYRSVGWNNALSPTTGAWAALTDASGNPPYQSGDFSILP